MGEEAEKSPEERLSAELLRAEEAGGVMASQGRVITKKGQSISDHAGAIRGLLEIAPELLDIETQIFLWQETNKFISPALDRLVLTVDEMDDSSTTSNLALISGAYNVNQVREYVSNLPPEKRHRTNLAIENFDSIMSNPDYKEEALKLLKLWGFDKPLHNGEKSPSELLRTAHDALDQPVDDSIPVSTSLIPIRGCVQSVIDEINSRKPGQEKTGTYPKKIISIGSQIKKEGVSMDVVHEWASQWHKLGGKLSSAKKGSMKRPEWRRLLQQATLFLISLLKGLVPSKMRIGK